MRGFHPEFFVNLLRSGVFFFNIEPKTADVFLFAGGFFHKIIQKPVNSASAVFGQNINALNPPKPAVAPIAPFKSHHQTAGDAPVLFGDRVKSLTLIFKNRRDAALQNLAVESFALGFERHCLIELDQRRRVRIFR